MWTDYIYVDIYRLGQECYLCWVVGTRDFAFPKVTVCMCVVCESSLVSFTKFCFIINEWVLNAKQNS